MQKEKKNSGISFENAGSKRRKATLWYIKNIYLKNKGRFGGDGDTYRSRPWKCPKEKAAVHA